MRRLTLQRHHLKFQSMMVISLSNMAKFFLDSLARSVLDIWLSDRTVELESFSSDVPASARQDADSPWSTRMACSLPSGATRLGSREREQGDACNRHFAFMTGQENRRMFQTKNLIADEPNLQDPNSANDVLQEAATDVPLDFEALNTTHHQLGEETGGLDESRLCLLDTACTSCMCSREWRLSYTRHLPPDLQAELQETDQWKTFHFANGSSTEERAQVWRIPVVIAGHRSVVLSAEIPTGSTPLLLSISAMSAFDMSLYMQKRTVFIGTMQQEVPMLMTRTRHLALDITGVETATPSRVTICSAEDVFLYLVEEASYRICDGKIFEDLSVFSFKASKHALKLGQRGVRVSDSKGELSQRRSKELWRAQQQLQLQDTRSWIALRRDYTYAEQRATRQFTTTVIFEPWKDVLDALVLPVSSSAGQTANH